jgi:hypothetical protein
MLAALVVVSTTISLLPTARGETDGAVPEGVRVFDDHVPAVANLDPCLLRALREAARDAAKAPWHYELRPEASKDGCPSIYADPRHDPRMHQ